MVGMRKLRLGWRGRRGDLGGGVGRGEEVDGGVVVGGGGKHSRMPLFANVGRLFSDEWYEGRVVEGGGSRKAIAWLLARMRGLPGAWRVSGRARFVLGCLLVKRVHRLVRRAGLGGDVWDEVMDFLVWEVGGWRELPLPDGDGYVDDDHAVAYWQSWLTGGGRTGRASRVVERYRLWRGERIRALGRRDERGGHGGHGELVQRICRACGFEGAEDGGG